MASTKTILARYQAIIRRLKKSAASFDEIADYLEKESQLMGLELQLAPRTFKRDREDLLESFGIDIQYDSKRGVYHIVDEHHLDNGNRLFEAFNLSSAIQLSDRLGAIVMPEKRRPIGSEHFYGLVYAIDTRRKIRFGYYKIEDDISSERTVVPLALKESLGYWYLIAKDDKDGRIKTFATDRISDLSIDGKTKEKIDFDGNSYFAHSYGIIVPTDSQPQTIELSFAWQQGQYVKRFPLHESQQIVSEDEHRVVIRLFLFITFDFEQKLMSFGPDVQVISPHSLATTLVSYYTRALTLYKN
ncbi:MAG: WYL domain-containing protein [Chitinophagaceae bacterium]|nr:WYL domain-containing protein [Chitinophagaceae bacterium]